MQNKKNIFWTDTHCHLDLLKKDIPTVLADAEKNNVTRLITIAIDKKSAEKVCLYANQYKNVYGTIGIHPHEAKLAQEGDYSFIEETLGSNTKIVALGECGYDFYHRHSSYTTQKKALQKQLAIALNMNYPVVIHSRQAEKETMETLKPFLEKGLKVLFHSFTSNDDLANFGIAFDCYFSFNGIITFGETEHFIKLIKKISLDRILLETDAPFLSPIPLRGKKNLPQNVAIIGEFLAKHLDLTIETLSNKTNKNAEKFFKGLN